MSERYDYMDWLRVFAITAVVGVHTVSKIINTETPDDWAWQFANWIDSALRWCVPIFFMLSGALLLTKKKDEPVGGFLKKRLSKVIVPLLFWSAIYIVYAIFEKGETYTFWEMIKLFLTDDVYFHLWFLYVIIGLYLMAPFLRMLVHQMSKKMFQYLLGFWVLFSVLLPFVPKFLDFEPAFSAGLFEPYIGYFMLGAYLVLYPISKKYLPLLAVLAVAGYAATVWGTEYLTVKNGELDEFFYEHYRPNALFITLFIFTAFQSMAPKFKPNPLITRISTATLGIYVIHPLVQLYLNKFLGINEEVIHPAIGVPLSWIIVFILSFGIIAVLQKIPIANKIVP